MKIGGVSLIKGILISAASCGALTVLFTFEKVSQAAETTTLAALQQDVIYAKDKQNSFGKTMDVIDSSFEKQRSAQLLQEAQRLVDELTRQGYSSTQNEIKLEPPKPDKPKTAPAKPLVLKHPDPFSLPIVFKAPWQGAVQERKPSEAELLYKVAISDGKITLREAVDIGMATNYAAKAALKKVEAAQAKLVEAKRALFPTAQANWSTNGGLIGGRFYKGENRQLIKFSQPLYYGGELVLTVKQAEENVKSSKMEYRKLRNDYVHSVRTSYYGVIKAEYNVQYEYDLYKKATGFYKRIKQEHDQRLISEVDYLNVESQYQQIYFQVDSAQNDLASANVLLHQTMNLDIAKEVAVDLELRFSRVSPVFEELQKMAMENNPDYRTKELAVSSAKYGVDVFRAKKLPRFDLRGALGYEGEVYHDTQAFEEGKANNNLDREWYLGVHGSMPLGASSVEYDQIKHNWGPTISAYQGSVDWMHKGTFNLFDRLSDITDEKSAQAAYLQSVSDLDKTRFDLYSKLREDFYGLQKALIQIDASIAKVRYQEKQNAINEYLLGMQEFSAGNFFEGLIEYAQSKFAFIQAVIEYHLAVSSLSVSVGDTEYFERTNLKS